MSERAAVYARISEDPRQTEEGVSRQRQDCESLVKARGWELVGTFTDNDVAVLRPGASRPGYEALMAAVDRGEVTRVVAYGLSRLWRSRTERAAAIERLKDRRVSVALVKGSDLDMTSAAGRMYAGFLGEVDTGESEIKAERVARAALQRAEQGRAAGHVAFGWRRVRDRAANGEVTGWRDEIDPDAAEIVQEIVRRLLAHESLSAVARDLTIRGVPTPRAWLARANGEDVAAGTWGTGTVRKVATRPANVGRIVRSREIAGPSGTKRVREEFGDALAPAIVDRRDHDRVVALLSEPSRTTSTRRQEGAGGHVRPGARLHLLTYGIGACGSCGTHLRVVHRGGHAMYACDAPSGCVGRRQEWVDDWTARVVLARLQRPDARDLLADDDPAADEARERAATLRARLDTAADDYAEGTITRDQLKRITARLVPELEQAEQQARRSIPGVPVELLDDLAGPRAREVWDDMTVTRRRALLDALSVSVVIRPARGGPGFKPESVLVSFVADEDSKQAPAV